MNQEMLLMKKWMMIAAAALYLIMFPPFHLNNAYLCSDTFDTVTVSRHESVWDIAGRYTVNGNQARKLTEAIIEVNDLSSDGAVRSGQKLRVPVLVKQLPPQLAER